MTAFLAILCILLYVAWIEVAIARTIRRNGRTIDMLVLIGIHLGLIFGLAAGVFFQQQGFLSLIIPPNITLTWREGLIFGARMSLTYMGYFVVFRVVLHVLRELIAVRGSPSLFDRSTQHLRGEPADVGSLGCHHGLLAGARLHPLVPRPASPRRNGTALCRNPYVCSARCY